MYIKIDIFIKTTLIKQYLGDCFWIKYQVSCGARKKKLLFFFRLNDTLGVRPLFLRTFRSVSTAAARAANNIRNARRFHHTTSTVVLQGQSNWGDLQGQQRGRTTKKKKKKTIVRAGSIFNFSLSLSLSFSVSDVTHVHVR